MSSEIEKARKTLLGEPIVTDHGETTCDLCVFQSLREQNQSLQERDTTDWEILTEQRDTFVASLWRKNRNPTREGQSVAMEEYTVMNLYHLSHVDEDNLGLDPDEGYHQLLVEATAKTVPLDESEYETNLLIEGSDNTYAVFDEFNEISYSSPDQGSYAPELSD
ncbi:hypothetical protein [Natronorubrum tibetense]|uniref:Uncharacterized protein n=1 Tax=Natronorubrum tibetense GA33 TaxID=1114856 RepID=L9VLE6_9EURY|nr:hypothetical protein [Natronorubrum tibetense]ELY37797.1 hypothetical protein C496_19885 [Natronorubrum tibetense GA33]